MSGTALKITKFFGEAPKISPELLPESVAQYAFNLDLSSGDLLPYAKSSIAATLDKVGTVLSVYPMTSPVDGSLKWLHWITDVDVATSQLENDTSQRIYYTGDGVPKTTNYTLATSGTQFPSASYTLGLPAPTATPTLSAAVFTNKTAATRSRDSGNTATITFAAAHGFVTGNYITTTGMGGTGYDLTNVPVTVTSTTSLTYFSFGAAEGSTASTGTVSLAGDTSPRNYVFTYLTAWGEESVPSAPSADVFVKEGQVVTVNGLPASWPHGAGYQTAGMTVNVYRSVALVSGTDYFKVGNVALGTTSFVDNIDVSTLDVVIPSTDYDQPNAAMQGILAIHNGMLVGFFGNTVCFCEPGKPHAWPIKYRKQVDSPIVALGAFGTTLLVLTDRTPWTLNGNNPSAQSLSRTDYVLPCVSKRSVINIGYGVAWASTGGLAVYSTSIGSDYLTKNVHSWNSWNTAITPTALFGEYYRGRYFGSDATRTFMFERNEQVGGHLVETDISFTAAYYKSNEDKFYYVKNGTVYLWNDATQQPLILDWKSKVFTTKDFVNFGAARLIADYATVAQQADLNAQNAAIRVANAARIAAGDPMGALCTDLVGQRYVDGSANVDFLTTNYTATFQLFVNKVLVYTTTRSTSDAFRLPAGYRADTFEIRIATTARVRAIHMAETMAGLRGV